MEHAAFGIVRADLSGNGVAAGVDGGVSTPQCRDLPALAGRIGA